MKRLAQTSRVLTIAVTLLLAACQSGDSAAPTARQQPHAVKVNTVTLVSHTVALTRSLPARAIAYRQAEVRPQVNGIIEKKLFEGGSSIKAGQQLYQIDPVLYEATVANAKAQLAQARAILPTAKAKQIRYKKLLANQAISQQDYDDALAAYQQALAGIKLQQAAVKTAETNLKYTQVNAPISGQISKSTFTEGALVTARQTEVMATINQLDPMYIDILQPSKELLRLRKQMIAKKLNQHSMPKVTLTMEDGSQYTQTGKLQFTEASVDPSTGDVVLRAVMPNPDHLLLPGMFVRAQITEGVVENAILAPQRGISFDREGNATAMVVNKDSKVELRPLTLDRAVGKNWLVKSGLNSGDQLIVAGLQKIAPGATVSIDQNTQQTVKSGA